MLRRQLKMCTIVILFYIDYIIYSTPLPFIEVLNKRIMNWSNWLECEHSGIIQDIENHNLNRFHFKLMRVLH